MMRSLTTLNLLGIPHAQESESGAGSLHPRLFYHIRLVERFGDLRLHCCRNSGRPVSLEKGSACPSRALENCITLS